MRDHELLTDIIYPIQKIEEHVQYDIPLLD